MVAATRSRIRRRSTTRRSTSPLAVTTPTPRRPPARRRPGTAPPPLRSRRARVPRCAAGLSTPDGPTSRTTAAPAPGSRPARNLAGTPGVSTPSTAPVPARGSGPPRAPRLLPAARPAPTGPGPPTTGTGRPRGRHRRNDPSPQGDVSAVSGCEEGSLLADRSRRQLDDDVELAEVAGVLLQQMEQHPLQGRRLRARPPRPWLSALVEAVPLDDLPATRPLAAEPDDHLGQAHARRNLPPAVLLVRPRVTDVVAQEAPLQPPALDVLQMDPQLQRRPARGEPAAGDVVRRKLLELGDDPLTEVAQVAEKHLGPGRPGVRRLGKGDIHRRSLAVSVAEPATRPCRRPRSSWSTADPARRGRGGLRSPPDATGRCRRRARRRGAGRGPGAATTTGTRCARRRGTAGRPLRRRGRRESHPRRRRGRSRGRRDPPPPDCAGRRPGPRHRCPGTGRGRRWPLRHRRARASTRPATCPPPRSTGPGWPGPGTTGAGPRRAPARATGRGGSPGRRRAVPRPTPDRR